MRIALTGGIACGKSTATAIFTKHGYHTLSTDALGHEMLRQPEVVARLRDRYGDTVLAPDGGVHRPALARLVFADPAERLWLEALVHPLIHQRWHDIVAANPTVTWIVEIPLLFEKKLETQFDFSVCVACTRESQLRRLALRGEPAEQARGRLQAQFALDEKVRLADICLFNEGTPEFLEQQILLLIRTMREQTKDS